MLILFYSCFNFSAKKHHLSFLRKIYFLRKVQTANFLFFKQRENVKQVKIRWKYIFNNLALIHFKVHAQIRKTSTRLMRGPKSSDACPEITLESSESLTSCPPNYVNHKLVKCMKLQCLIAWMVDCIAMGIGEDIIGCPLLTIPGWENGLGREDKPKLLFCGWDHSFKGIFNKMYASKGDFFQNQIHY